MESQEKKKKGYIFVYERMQQTSLSTQLVDFFSLLVSNDFYHKEYFSANRTVVKEKKI